MTTVPTASAAGPPLSPDLGPAALDRPAGRTGARRDPLAEGQRLARLNGLQFPITYATSIPVALSL